MCLSIKHSKLAVVECRLQDVSNYLESIHFFPLPSRFSWAVFRYLPKCSPAVMYDHYLSVLPKLCMISFIDLPEVMYGQFHRLVAKMFPSKFQFFGWTPHYTVWRNIRLSSAMLNSIKHSFMTSVATPNWQKAR